MLALVLALSRLLFAGAEADLSSSRWATREAATRTLTRYWPLTEQAVSTAERSADPEAVDRAVRVRRAVARRSATRALALLGQPFTYDELDALAMLTDVHERDGLPWASDEAWAHLSDPRLSRFLETVRRRLGLLPDAESLWLDPGAWRAGSFNGGQVTGLSELRFAFRGLPAPRADWREEEAEAVRRQWAEAKGGR